jgi:hypothetical protein
VAELAIAVAAVGATRAAADRRHRKAAILDLEMNRGILEQAMP